MGGLVPDLRWDTLELFEVPCEAGTVYVHLGIAQGTPVGPFLGVDPPTGRSFHCMALDVHYVVGGKIKESWHVEDWQSAVVQLTGGLGSRPVGEMPPLHSDQPCGFEVCPAEASGSNGCCTLL